MDEKHAILQTGRTYRHRFNVCGAIRFARAVCSVRNAKLASRTRVIRVGLPEPRLAGHCDRMGSYWRSKIVVALLALSRTRSCGISYLVRQLCRQRDYLAQRTLPADRRRQDDSKEGRLTLRCASGHCTRNVSLNSPPRLGGVAAPSIKCREASLAGADGVVDQ